MSTFEASNARLLARLPKEQADRVFGADRCEISPDFLGFVDIYERLAEIVPPHWTIVDLGCAFAPQLFFFDEHARYFGVDLLTPNEARFNGPNSVHYHGTIAAFISEWTTAPLAPPETTFAICSYVPPWHGDNRRLARETFENVFTFYPAGDPWPIVPRR
jgi:hypothetical protein